MNRTQSIVATIVAFFVAVNEVLMAFGITEFADVTQDTIYAIVSTVAMAISWAYSLWKNHNFTESANIAQGLLEMKKGKLEAEGMDNE